MSQCLLNTKFLRSPVINKLYELKVEADVIVANRMMTKLTGDSIKVCTSDLFGHDPKFKLLTKKV